VRYSSESTLGCELLLRLEYLRVTRNQDPRAVCLSALAQSGFDTVNAGESDARVLGSHPRKEVSEQLVDSQL